ncbi:hypothetical protein [Paenibacillus tyrfis]|uniref:hypothetical protein n=1 Tax=Paenibacillus tyrfis TaxID=1501230 RepID=UPI0020A16339|nr:hypothetical protein [Paenibacillus tyrfis]MCP1311916.1 hypothetical protein [Paenibacillus tyrfis]
MVKSQDYPLVAQFYRYEYSFSLTVSRLAGYQLFFEVEVCDLSILPLSDFDPVLLWDGGAVSFEIATSHLYSPHPMNVNKITGKKEHSKNENITSLDDYKVG